MEKINMVLAALDLEAGSEAVLGRAAQLASKHAALGVDIEDALLLAERTEI